MLGRKEVDDTFDLVTILDYRFKQLKSLCPWVFSLAFEILTSFLQVRKEALEQNKIGYSELELHRRVLDQHFHEHQIAQ